MPVPFPHLHRKPRFPLLPPMPAGAPKNRLGLAQWLVNGEHPLTARVSVNRMWAQLFGTGLVKTVEDFGSQGEMPSHRELLDYLAGRLVENGWSLKALHREILLSNTYRLASDAAGEGVKKDPDNRLLWRANAVERLDAEALRDSILAVAGTLDEKMGGAGKKFGDEMTRRAIYGIVSRSQPDRTMALFDFPDATAHAEQRIVTVGPMQRLFFMNSPFVAGQAKALGARIEKMGIAAAYELLYGRPATAEEIRLGEEFTAGGGKWAQYAQVLLAAAEFSAVK
jgi:hypothetical protein